MEEAFAPPEFRVQHLSRNSKGPTMPLKHHEQKPVAPPEKGSCLGGTLWISHSGWPLNHSNSWGGLLSPTLAAAPDVRETETARAALPVPPPFCPNAQTPGGESMEHRVWGQNPPCLQWVSRGSWGQQQVPRLDWTAILPLRETL